MFNNCLFLREKENAKSVNPCGHTEQWISRVLKPSDGTFLGFGTLVRITDQHFATPGDQTMDAPGKQLGEFVADLLR